MDDMPLLGCSSYPYLPAMVPGRMDTGRFQAALRDWVTITGIRRSPQLPSPL